MNQATGFGSLEMFVAFFFSIKWSNHWIWLYYQKIFFKQRILIGNQNTGPVPHKKLVSLYRLELVKSLDLAILNSLFSALNNVFC